MSDNIATAYSAALDAMGRTGPKSLHQLAGLLGDEDVVADGSALLSYLRSAGPEDALRQQFTHVLAGWDHIQTDAKWAAGTDANTAERRDAIIGALVLDAPTRELFADRFPFAASFGPIVIADDWEEWRTEERRHDRNFYWAHYRRYLLDKGWAPEAVNGLDLATEEVVRRLSDPTRTHAYQAKGLVVGYVQSGKTANFTGVIAKAVDAGYRLVVVLTGTTNMLRAQTQRRLDLELLGRENLELEISAHDKTAHEYEDDPDWEADKFIRHGGRPSDAGYPDIRRLSTHSWDYRRLRQGFSALEFHRRERTKNLFEPVNLFTSDARLVVAKKNKSVLQDLVADLGRISDRLGEVPVLIIDDESDQASVNTTSPAKWKNDSKERTAINELIGQLLGMMRRAQYVGYTATPYANVFVDPSDVEDIFPRDFLVSLPRPPGYMGAEDFHDFDSDMPLEQRSIAESQERRHVRLLSEEPAEDELFTALDMYVLTGAVKLYRERHGYASYRHHTMLVHEAMGRDSHKETAALITRMWRNGDYRGPSGLRRLRRLYEKDVLEVSRLTAPDHPTPADFDDLKVDIGMALNLMTPPDRDASPVLVVNSDPDLEKQQESLDFDRRKVWRILVGGNKLARGFTVEGLTVTYYRRATSQVDTLMQMGRWFGFRPRFRDLVRIYTTEDLHSMFAAACQDEAYLRAELQRYAQPNNGQSQITPRQVPPLIAQHRPDLRPAARNKMWNARLVERSSPGEPMEPVAYPDPNKGTRKTETNNKLWLPVLARATEREIQKFQTVRAVKVGDKTSTRLVNTRYDARVAIVSHTEMLAILDGIQWNGDDTFKPEIAWLRSLRSDQLDRWVVLLPLQSSGKGARQKIMGHGPFDVFQRIWTPNRGSLRVISEFRHRNAAHRIAGLSTSVADPAADALHQSATGSVLLYPVAEKDDIESSRSAKAAEESPSDIPTGRITLAFHMVTPMSTMPLNGRLIKWQARDSRKPTALVVDAQPGDS
ncbi:Z1 domain-containing protein [Actinoplanes sp. LDG1-06]|uniref:Z1 domain-containing protein n=1 Tax=Paractinoplanes ovalisporus TaxID=2810368 RepID=A0ABS2AB49_9ACTN|nr:Z1 domain-containing protein [Actinoplanes ovalisporus]MBM2617042.1 Z1 domain-containing protein [Actinoplanes ovalisporus]